MMLRQDAQKWTVKEQIIHDIVTGLSFQFEVPPSGFPVLRVFGKSLPNGNRDLYFNLHGEKDGAGTNTDKLCKPAWPTETI